MHARAMASYTEECAGCAILQLDKSSCVSAYAATLHTKIILVSPWALSEMASRGTHADAIASCHR